MLNIANIPLIRKPLMSIDYQSTVLPAKEMVIKKERQLLYITDLH